MNPTITAAHGVTITVLDEHATALRRSRERQGYLTPTGVREHMAQQAHDLEWLPRLDAAAANVQGQIDAADAQARLTALGSPTGSAQEQMLAEQRAYRAWQRLRSILEPLDAATVHHRLQRALDTATGDERRIIAEELPAFVESHDLPIDADAVIQTALLNDHTYAAADAQRTATHNDAAAAAAAVKTVRDHVSGTMEETAHIDLLVRGIAAV